MRLLSRILRSQMPAHNHALVVNGHPDPRPERFCAALCAAFSQGAHAFGHQIRNFSLADAKVYEGFGACLESLSWSDRMFVSYPLWLGEPPPPLRQLFDAYSYLSENAERYTQPKASRVMVTASLPALLYRVGNASEKFSVPSLTGLEAAQTIVIGSVDTISRNSRERWLADAWRMGAQRCEAG